MSAIVWGYSDNEHGEDGWYGTLGTREEAIAEARAHYGLGAEDVCWICQGRVPSPREFVPSTDWITDHMGEQACDEVGEAADEWPPCSDVAAAELQQLLGDWAEKHCPLRFWVADGTPEAIGGKQ